MNGSSKKNEGNKKVNEIKTLTVPFPLIENQENITISTNTPSKYSKKELINQAFKFHSQRNILEAAKYVVPFLRNFRA